MDTHDCHARQPGACAAQGGAWHEKQLEYADTLVTTVQKEAPGLVWRAESSHARAQRASIVR